MAEKFKEIDITKDELDRIGNALKNKEFRDLLVEYCEELHDPANRKQYEEEITQLEKERGVQVTFIHPTASYVIKTSIDGNKLAFINICSNDHVDKPSSKNACQEGSRGLEWSLPHLMSPPRDDMSKKGSRCSVYDVIFHSQTLHLASRNTEFREMVNKVSCEAVESHFSIVLDKSNLKFPKMKYKGMSRPLVIRKKTGEPVKNGDIEDEAEKLYSQIYNKMDEHYDKANSECKAKHNKNYTSQKISEYATPKYTIKHRSDLDIQDFTYDRDAKINATVPKDLIVEINLPLLKSAGDVVLDVTEKSLKIISEKPSKYKLDLTLPYSINEDNGNAKFDIDNRKLVVTLPVKRNCNMLLSDIGRYDSGVDSDSSPLADSDKSLPLIQELSLEDSVVECSSVDSESDVFRTSEKFGFLNADLHYSLPEYTCHLFDNVLSFTLNVKNVDTDSIKKEYNNSSTSLHIKFSSISSGYFPINYAFFVDLPTHFIDSKNVSIEAWDNNVILQIPYKPYDTITSYFIGTCQEDSQENYLEEPSIINNKHIEIMNNINKGSKPNVEVQLDSDDELTITINPENDENEFESSETSPKSRSLSESSLDEDTKSSHTKSSPTKAQNIKSRSLSESSMDESSTSVSSSKKSILKSHYRSLVSRSVSESSVDDYIWSSFENCAANSESLIPEETEGESLSSSMKKTVRFNDVVSKQLFRSNSSILGQRKKNQRKNRKKKRAQERRVSESENSEAEDKKEKSNSPPEKNGADYFKKEAKTNENVSKINDKQHIDFKSDLIFDLDM